MKVWFIRYADDSPEVDGIWLTNEDYQQFFISEGRAADVCESLNATRRSDWAASDRVRFEQWEKVETAYEGVESLGLNPSEVFPYHKREFPKQEHDDVFVVDSIEVAD